MSSTFTTNKNIELPGNNDYINTWNVPVNSDFTIIDKALGSGVSIALASTNYNFTTTDIQNQRITLTGTLTANVQVIFPSGVGGMWVVTNATLGAYTVIATIGGGGNFVVLQQSANSIIYSDGTNVAFADSRASSGGGGATGGGSDQIFFLNGQEITNSYTIPTASNAITGGPITIDAGATVTINPPSVWTII